MRLRWFAFAVVFVTCGLGPRPSNASEPTRKAEWDGFGLGSWVVMKQELKTEIRQVSGAKQEIREDSYELRETLVRIADAAYSIRLERKTAEGAWSHVSESAGSRAAASRAPKALGHPRPTARGCSPGSSASCRASGNRGRSSRNSTVCRSYMARSRAAASMTALTSLTPAVTADSSTNLRPAACATRCASVVLPVPGGPQRIAASGPAAPA